jgi:transposase
MYVFFMQSTLSPPTAQPTHYSSVEYKDLLSRAACDMDCPLKDALFTLRYTSNYYQSQHTRARLREDELKKKNEELKERIRYLEHQLYGRKSERHFKRDSLENGDKPKRKRGHQRGESGHSRRDYSSLPTTEEMIFPDSCVCPYCGLPFIDINDTDDGEILTITVEAHRRVYRRKKYKPSCTCSGNVGIITAPVPPKLIPKTNLDISVWVELLLEKYHYQRPLSRVLNRLSDCGLDLPIGTVCDNIGRIAPLFDPIREIIEEKSLQESWWHADETRWQVFELIEGKCTYRWFVWVFVSESTVVYVLASGRGSDVVEDHLGSVENGFLCVDRYSAYKCFAKTHTGFILVFCWAHVRRDFLDVGKRNPEYERWSHCWVTRIGELYHLNNVRISYAVDTPEFMEYDRQLRKAVATMSEDRERELNDADISVNCRKVLESLKNHWHGLTVFVDHPHIPMDNNKAERTLRNSVVGRKNYYGSATVQSGYFAVTLFSLFQTLSLWQINPRTWLTCYLHGCTCNGGSKAPEDVSSFMPWNMSDTQRKFYSSPPAPG